MKNLLLILGNGFTIDLLLHLGINSKVDVVNLFSKGDTVIWPDGSNRQGFLSYKYCPALWNLGARPDMDNSSASDLIEDIITCANMMSSSDMEPQENNIYINAYFELVAYLKHLFIQYNAEVSDDDLSAQSVLNWGWFDLIKSAYNNEEYEKIIIITYNYDIFLERILKLHDLNFRIEGIDKDNAKIVILKPHGSISFAHQNKNESSMFKIRKSRDMYEATLPDFSVNYTCLNDNYLINALIPPAGDSSRMTYKWANEIRTLMSGQIEQISEGDKVVMGRGGRFTCLLFSGGSGEAGG